MSYNEIVFFSLFIFFVCGMLALDLGVFSKKDHVISFREAGIWSLVWISFALIFYVILKTHGDLIHGINDFDRLREIVYRYGDEHQIYISKENFELSLQNYRDNQSIEFITGYLTEYALSVDNIFVIIMIFTSFSVRQKYYKKVLFWGIIGAIIMRFSFIFLGAALIQNFNWVLYIFGGFLLFTGAKMFLERDGDDEIEPDDHPIVKLASKYFSVFPRYVNEYFFIRKHGKLMVTPLFVVLLIIEFTDLIFAVDSVPAVFSITQDPYIVFFSNIFAIMGLRSMFFFLTNIMHLFHYLKTGLALLLIFIGGKMIAHHWLENMGFKTEYSLYVIIGILSISVIASLIFPQEKEEKESLEKKTV